MKSLLFTFLALITGPVFFVSSASAQSEGYRYGLRFGIGQANINKADVAGQTGKLAINAGFTGSYQFTKNIGGTADLLFTTKGSRASGTVSESTLFGTQSYNYEEKFKLYYIEVPVLLKLSYGFNSFYIKFFGGPSANFNVLGTQTREYSDADYNKQNGFADRKIQGLNLFELATVFGTGFDIELPNEEVISLDVRRSVGLNSFGTINARSAYNNYFAIGVAYLYR